MKPLGGMGVDRVDRNLCIVEGHTESVGVVPGFGQSLTVTAQNIGEVFTVVVAEPAILGLA